ncbi:hypothetical protein BB559_001492 [Furculomyces boomerangus]|uniref:Acid phosphatase n=1 Tax=Furculomyces boomerangus TaxID=61424 RepID=A0A2T9Z1P0_9FUNG|nr:hypothetical protein BB559_001492 [Furculomyces boomerangus]
MNPKSAFTTLPIYLLFFTTCTNGFSIYNALFKAQSNLKSLIYQNHPIPEGYTYCQAEYPIADNYKKVPNSELLHVQLFLRHGDRTPENLIKNELVDWNDCKQSYDHIQLRPNNSEQTDITFQLIPQLPAKSSTNTDSKKDFSSKLWTGSCSVGQLTDLGKQQHIQLGKAIRELYVEKLNFLDSELSSANIERNINVRTSQIWRTQNTAESFLNGLYPSINRKNQTNIPMNYYPIQIETMLSNTIMCPKIKLILQKIALSRDYINYLKSTRKEMAKLNHIFGVNTNADSKWLYSWISHMDVLQPRLCNNKPYPCNLDLCASKQDAKFALNNANFETKYIKRDSIYSDMLTRLTAGPLLNEILVGFNKVIENKDKNNQIPKLSIFSAHDETLTNLLGAFKANDEGILWPPYASNLAIELWKQNPSNGQSASHSIRILYNGKTLQVLGTKNEINKPWCDFNSCDYSNFEKYLTTIIPDDIIKECEI